MGEMMKAMSIFSKTNGKKQLNSKLKRVTDKGFSLIEVLVAMVILAIISLPILSAFMSAAKVNLKARQQENATAVGQKIIEGVKAKTVEQYLNEMSGKYVRNMHSSTGLYTYTFNLGDYDATGRVYDTSKTDEDRFFVRVTLNPDEFANKVDGTGTTDNINNNINSFNMPSFTELQSDDNFAIMKQVYQHDAEAEAALGVDKSLIYREIDVYVHVTDKDATGSVNQEGTFVNFTQTVKLNVTYHVYGTSQAVSYESVVGTHVIKGNMEETKYRNVYLFYSPYDKFRNDAADAHKERSRDLVEFHVTTDTQSGKFNSQYAYNDNTLALSDKKINLYLVEQESKNIYTVQDTYVKLQKGNIKVEYNGSECLMNAGTVGIGGNNNINLLTNVEDLVYTNATGSVTNSITQNVGEDSEIKYLYNIQVEIWVNQKPEDGEAFVTIQSTKENAHE